MAIRLPFNREKVGQTESTELRSQWHTGCDESDATERSTSV